MQAKHATYIDYKQHRWHFFDSNQGTFEFSDHNNFKRFYQQIYQDTFSWHTYQMFIILNKKSAYTWRGTLLDFSHFYRSRSS